MPPGVIRSPRSRQLVPLTEWRPPCSCAARSTLASQRRNTVRSDTWLSGIFAPGRRLVLPARRSTRKFRRIISGRFSDRMDDGAAVGFARPRRAVAARLHCARARAVNAVLPALAVPAGTSCPMLRSCSPSKNPTAIGGGFAMSTRQAQEFHQRRAASCASRKRNRLSTAFTDLATTCLRYSSRSLHALMLPPIDFSHAFATRRKSSDAGSAFVPLDRYPARATSLRRSVPPLAECPPTAARDSVPPSASPGVDQLIASVAFMRLPAKVRNAHECAAQIHGCGCHRITRSLLCGQRSFKRRCRR